jgi:hypothetical protein
MYAHIIFSSPPAQHNLLPGQIRSWTDVADGTLWERDPGRQERSTIAVMVDPRRCVRRVIPAQTRANGTGHDYTVASLWRVQIDTRSVGAAKRRSVGIGETDPRKKKKKKKNNTQKISNLKAAFPHGARLGPPQWTTREQQPLTPRIEPSFAPHLFFLACDTPCH